MDQNRNFRLLFVITLVVALILACLLIYLFWIKPSVQGFVVQKQIEAKDLTLMALVSQVQQQGYAQITIGNQSLVLVPYSQEVAAIQQQLAQQRAGQAQLAG